MSQLYYYDNWQNSFHGHLAGDPVRGHIPLCDRYSHNRGCFFLTRNGYYHPESICCAAFLDEVPQTEEHLFVDAGRYDVATFYTVWATQGAKPGAGRKIINQALQHIRWFKPFVKRAVTLSPKTEMAHKFHLSNGAILFRENETTINYEYTL